MSKVTKKGIIKKVGLVEEVGEKNTKKQIVVLWVPARKDEFNETIGQDDLFELTAIGKKVEDLKLTAQLLEKKVEVDFYINGRQFDKTDGTKGYAINANIMSIKVLEDKPTSSVTTENKVPSNF